MAALNVRDLGDFIRDQRRAAQISLRQLARQAGVSNPYLSQIERGLRKPSAEILQQIAKALRISAEVLYVQAGILEEREVDDTVAAAILTDRNLTERQKQVVFDIYQAFRQENVRATAPDGPATAGPESPDSAPEPAESVAEAVKSVAEPAAPEPAKSVAKAAAPEPAAPEPGKSVADAVKSVAEAAEAADTQVALPPQASRATPTARTGGTRAASGSRRAADRTSAAPTRSAKRRASSRPPEQDTSNAPEAGDAGS